MSESANELSVQSQDILVNKSYEFDSPNFTDTYNAWRKYIFKISFDTNNITIFLYLPD